MWTRPDPEAEITEAVRGWVHWMGVDEPAPLGVATQRATEAYRQGATMSDACGLARAFVLSWLRHPANTGRAFRRDVA